MAVSALILIGFLALNIALFWHFRHILWLALLGPSARVETVYRPADRPGAPAAVVPVSRPPLRLVA